MSVKKQNESVAVISGGSGGIGSAIAMELSQAGHYIIVNYHSNPHAAEKVIGQISDRGGRGETVQFDITSFDETKRAIDDIIARFERIEVLVNNAGITADGLMVMMSEKNWDSVVATTLKGFFNITKPVVKQMMRQKRGAIVSIASIAGLRGNKGQTNYAAAKAGLIAASRSLAVEVAVKGIRVNVVAPGLIETKMIEKAPVEELKKLIPMARIGRPEEVAKAVRFLCSDDASYITGEVLSVTGGMN